jgi:hypothetical protein
MATDRARVHPSPHNKKPRLACEGTHGTFFDATGFESAEVRFERGGVAVSTTVQYPTNPPDADSDARLMSASSEEPRTLLCGGCSDQDVFFRGVHARCHGRVLATHLEELFPERVAPVPRGLLGMYKAEEVVNLVDGENTVFVARGLQRGTATKSLGVTRTLRRSRYANPFVVGKKYFTLGESIALYRAWTKNHYKPLDSQTLQSTVNGAPSLPRTPEELLMQHPELFQ